jgi:hypothetical protein
VLKKTTAHQKNFRITSLSMHSLRNMHFFVKKQGFFLPEASLEMLLRLVQRVITLGDLVNQESPWYAKLKNLRADPYYE